MEQIKPPAWLGTVGKKKWKELLPQLERLDPQDRDSLALLCDSWETYLGAADDIREQGRSTPMPGGGYRVNPSVNTKNEAQKQILRLSKSFGLSPTPTGQRKTTSTSPLQELLQGDQ